MTTSNKAWAPFVPAAPRLLTDVNRTPEKFKERQRKARYAIPAARDVSTVLLVTEDDALSLRNPAIVDMLRRYSGKRVVDVWETTGAADESAQRGWAEARQTVCAGSTAVVGYGEWHAATRVT